MFLYGKKICSNFLFLISLRFMLPVDLFPTFLEKKGIFFGWGEGQMSHFMFSSRFMLFPTYFREEKKIPGGGGRCQNICLWC